MHQAIEKLLQKRGIKSVEELSPEEKAQFDSWQKTLTTEKVTLPSLATFLNVQKSIIETQFGDINNTDQKNSRLTLQHAIYSKLIRYLESEKVEREALEKYLVELVDTPNT